MYICYCFWLCRVRPEADRKYTPAILLYYTTYACVIELTGHRGRGRPRRDQQQGGGSSARRQETMCGRVARHRRTIRLRGPCQCRAYRANNDFCNIIILLLFR